MNRDVSYHNFIDARAEKMLLITFFRIGVINAKEIKLICGKFSNHAVRFGGMWNE